MYAEMEPEDADTMVLPYAIGAPRRPRTTLGPRIQPPRLTAPLAGHSATSPRVTVADLHLPADLVHAQASALAENARSIGVHHSMRLWRDACREAIISLARASTATPASASCKALYWELSGDEYHISITFARTSSAMH